METLNQTITKWVIDPAHSEIQFKVKHLMITTVTGSFTSYEADVETAGDDFATAKILVKINTSSVTTGSDQRDGHIKSPDFFDPEKYPVMTFKSTAIKKVDEKGSYEMAGDLTIKDITKPIRLAVEYSGKMKDPWGSMKAGFLISGKINRGNWNLSWNAALESGGVLVSDEVRIVCEVQLAKQA